MKIKQKNLDKYKITLSSDELSVIRSILVNVRLGNGKNSDYIYDFIVATDDLCLDEYPVTFDVNKPDQCDTINV